MSDYKNEGGLIWRDLASPGCHIYIYIHVFVCVCVCVFVCDLAKALLASIDACYTKKNPRKIYSYLRAAAERERETRDARLSYIHKFVFVCVCGSMMFGGDGQRLSQ